jgi:hypothetical protein
VHEIKRLWTLDDIAEAYERMAEIDAAIVFARKNAPKGK